MGNEGRRPINTQGCGGTSVKGQSTQSACRTLHEGDGRHREYVAGADSVRELLRLVVWQTPVDRPRLTGMRKTEASHEISQRMRFRPGRRIRGIQPLCRRLHFAPQSRFIDRRQLPVLQDHAPVDHDRGHGRAVLGKHDLPQW